MVHVRNSGDGWHRPHGCRNDLGANPLTDPHTEVVEISGITTDGRRFRAAMRRDDVAEALDASGARWHRPHGGGNGWRIGPFELDVDHLTINGVPLAMSVEWN